MSSPDETPGKLNVLVAYPYMNGPMIDALKSQEADIRFVLDSGAFTAWKAGKPIALDDYCRFIEGLPIKPWRYFTLDVIGDPHASMTNYQIMLKRGFNPVPIFTRGEDPSVLDDYYKTSDVVGIGGLVGTRGNKGFVNGIMRHAKGRRVHWLGFTNMDFIKQWRPYMCDSSSFDAPLRFGGLPIYAGNAKFVRVTKKHFQLKPSNSLLSLIYRYKESPLALAESSQWRNTGRNETALERLCYKSAVWFNQDACRETGSKIFLACTTSWKIPSLFWAMKELRSANVIK